MVCFGERGLRLVFALFNSTSCPRFAIILLGKRADCFSLSFCFLATVSGLWLSLRVQWFGLQYVIVVFHDHSHCFVRLLHSILLQNALRRDCNGIN